MRRYGFRYYGVCSQRADLPGGLNITSPMRGGKFIKCVRVEHYVFKLVHKCYKQVIRITYKKKLTLKLGPMA